MMKFFERASLIYGTFWSITKERDDSLAVSNFGNMKNGQYPLSISSKEFAEFFDLSDEKNLAAKYMAENQSEIKNVLAGHNEEYQFEGVSVEASGDIYFHFTSDGGAFFGDKVPLNMNKCPCFTIYVDIETQKYFRVEASFTEKYQDKKILSTKIIEYQYGKNVRTIKTSMSPTGEPIAIVTETK